MAIGDFFEDNFSVAATLENAEDHLEDIGGSDGELEDQSNVVNDWVEDPRVFVSRDIPFTGPQPGPVFPDLNAFEILRRFITDEMLATVVANTNSFSTSNRRQTRRRRGTGTGVEETPLTVDEMWMFIAILMLIEVHGKPEIDDNWSTNWLLQTPVFNWAMPNDRFRSIMSSLHFAGDEEANPTDKIWKIRTVFELFRTQLKTAYNLDRVVSVDESILLWRGHHSLRRYIPSKAHAWGFKFYALANPARDISMISWLMRAVRHVFSQKKCFQGCKNLERWS